MEPEVEAMVKGFIERTKVAQREMDTFMRWYRRGVIGIIFFFAIFIAALSLAHAGTVNASGSLTAGGSDCSVAGRCLTLPVVSTGNGTLEVRGTFSATLLLECSIAGVSYSTVPLNPIAGTAAVTSLTAPGMWLFSGAFGVCRVRASAYTSGTATVDLLLTDASVPRLPSLAALGAAPSDATYVTISASAGLSAERSLTGTANQLTITDNGANSTVVLSIPAIFIAPGTIAATTTVTGTQLISSVATGTPPLTVASTTQVANLYASRAALADTVTTNANLTGPITSTGNATAVAAQTGTGSVFAMQASPAFTTPNIGVATGTSLQAIIGDVTPAAGTFTTVTANTSVTTPLLSVTAAANTVPLTISGYSVTGTNATSMMLLSGTLNQATNPVHVVDLSITDTAHASGSTLFRIRGGAAGATAAFAVDTSGNLTTSGTFSRGGLTVPGNGEVGSSAGWIQYGAGSPFMQFITSNIGNTSGGISTLYAGQGQFTPPSGSASFALLHLNPIINGTSTGTAYGLLLASKTNTLTGGTIKLASFGTTTTDGFTGYTEKWHVLTDGTTTSAGHIQSSTTAPTVSNTSSNSCGTTAATIVGTDVAGKVTVGATAGTSCTITFTTTWTNAPACVVTNETTANLLRATSTTTTVILAGTMVAGDVLAYMCLGRV